MTSNGMFNTAARVAVLALAGTAGSAVAQVDIRIGHGFAAEEQLWLMAAKPDIAPNNGKAYNLKLTAFRANADRLSAYEAGQLEGGTSTAATVLFAAEQGVPMKVVASVSREVAGGKWHNTSYVALSDSGITSHRDLRGKTVGISDFKSGCDLYARAAAAAGGLNPDRDVKYVVVPFPAMGQALRAKRIDVGCFPNPFFVTEMRTGGVAKVFDVKTAFPYDDELILLFLRPEFIAKNRAAARAFMSDYVATTRWYLANTKDAKQALIDRKFVQTPAAIYLDMPDWYREPTGKVTTDGMDKLQDLLIKLGWQSKKINLNELVDMSLLPQ
jgi:ABC-type nitrate/sulfonate/bicarbonate transport system substrate-binding protein